MFNLQERQNLNKLSLRMFGVEGKWRKMQEDTSFWIPTGETREKKRYNHVRIPVGKDKNKFQVLRVETANNLGLIKGEDQIAEYTKPVEEPVLRAPTAEELAFALETMFDSKVIGYLFNQLENPRDHSHEASFVYAYRYLEDTLRYSFGLEKKIGALSKEALEDPELAKKELESLIVEYDLKLNTVLAKLPENIAEDIRKAILPAEEFRRVGGFDARKFAIDVAYISDCPNDAEEKYQAIMNEASAAVERG